MFSKSLAPLKQPILEKATIVDELGKTMLDTRQVALASFDKNASRYHQGVYEKKRTDLLNKLNTQLNVLFVAQLKNLHKKALVLFGEQLKSELQKPSYNFVESVKECLATATNFFLEGAKGIRIHNQKANEAPLINGSIVIVLPETDWSYNSEYEALQEGISEQSAKARTDEFKKLSKALSVTIPHIRLERLINVSLMYRNKLKVSYRSL